MKYSFETRALWLYRRTGKHFWLYSAIARYKHWWMDASSFERWTVRVAAMLAAIMAGLILAYKIKGG